MIKSYTFQYNPAENLKRILMDKHTKYVVVEGEEDIPKYEATIKSLSNKEFDFEPIFLGGKENIKSLLQNLGHKNFVAITDKDFDEHTLTSDPRLIILSRYSIENFVFCPNVLIPLVAHLVRDTEMNTKRWFDLSDWITDLHAKLQVLLKALFYYQNNVLTNRKQWSGREFLENGSWRVCPAKVDQLLNDLFDNNIPVAEINSAGKYQRISRQDLVKYFPGKLLIRSLYRYIREKIVSKYGDARKLTSKIGNESVLIFNCSAHLHKQRDLRSELKVVIDFLEMEMQVN